MLGGDEAAPPLQWRTSSDAAAPRVQRGAPRPTAPPRLAPTRTSRRSRTQLERPTRRLRAGALRRRQRFHRCPGVLVSPWLQPHANTCFRTSRSNRLLFKLACCARSNAMLQWVALPHKLFCTPWRSPQCSWSVYMLLRALLTRSLLTGRSKSIDISSVVSSISPVEVARDRGLGHEG